MISVTRVGEAAPGEQPALAGDPQALVAGVGFHVVGDAGGRMLLWLPRNAAVELVDVLLRRPAGATKALNELGHSTIKETGNNMASAYLTGVCEFSGLLLMPSVPSLMFDLSEAILEMSVEGVERRDGRVLYVDNAFTVLDTGLAGRLFFFIDAGSEDVLIENAAEAF